MNTSRPWAHTGVIFMPKEMKKDPVLWDSKVAHEMEHVDQMDAAGVYPQSWVNYVKGNNNSLHNEGTDYYENPLEVDAYWREYGVRNRLEDKYGNRKPGISDEAYHKAYIRFKTNYEREHGVRIREIWL